MAVLLSLAEHLLNVKDVEVINCDISELKIKNIIKIMPLRSPGYGEPMIGMELKSCSDIALNALGVRNTM